MAIFHPPCTHLAVSGARWFKDKQEEQKDALEFVKKLLDCDIPKICLENPVSIISSKIRKPDQVIQPYWFGDPQSKKTCLWLKNLPKLVPTNIVEPEMVTLSDGTKDSAFHYYTWRLPKEKRWKERSRTFQGIANAMGDQWG